MKRTSERISSRNGLIGRGRIEWEFGVVDDNEIGTEANGTIRTQFFIDTN
jgi:hypothetical protein